MHKKTKKTKKAGFLTALIVSFLICLVLCVFFVFTQLTVAKGMFRDTNIGLAETLNQSIKNQIDSGFDKLLQDDTKIISSGEIDSIDGELSLELNIDGDSVTNSAISLDFAFEKTYNIFLIKHQDTHYTAISHKIDGKHNVAVLKDNALSIFIDKLSFKNVLLVNTMSGRILAAGESYLENYFQASNFNNANDYTRYYNENKDLYLLNSIEEYNLQSVVIISALSFKSFIDSTMIGTLLFAIALFVVVLIACSFMLLAILRSDFKLLFQNCKGYVLKADSGGNIISANKSFKKAFEVTNIFENVQDKDNLLQNAADGYLVLKLADKKSKDIVYARFKSLLDGEVYKLHGIDITSLYLDFINVKSQIEKDTITNLPYVSKLKSDFLKSASENLFEKFAVAVIEITNLNILLKMFGNDTFKNLLNNFTDTLKELYYPQIRLYYSTEENFLLFADNSMRTDILITTLQKSIDKLEAPLTINENVIKPMVKAGVKIIEKDFEFNSTLRDAKIALNYAKLSHTKPVQIFDARIMISAFSFFETKKSILELINSEKFDVYYQPQYNLKTKKIVGFEALSRICAPEFKNISISEFIKVAEQNGAIIELGNKIYLKAMQFAKKIEQYGVPVSLNVSPIQLLQEGFTENFLNNFKQMDLKPNSINIEITESFLMQSYEEVVNKLLLFKKEGIGIHLDDFGTEYSSMLHLNRLPINAIKIDREFVRDVLNNEYTKTIIDFMLKLSIVLGINCIVEGVEMAEQAEIINSLGGEVIQGFYISKAVEQNAAIAMLGDIK